MDRIALFPGTFDPITLGHVDIIKRSLPLVDILYVGIGVNALKNTMFSLTQRKQWIEKIFVREKKVKVISYEGLTVDCCKEIQAQFILRGVRTVKDFEYEKTIADMNMQLAKEVETVLLFSSTQYSTLASTLVRDVLRNNGNVAPFLPEEILENLREKDYIIT